MIAVHDVHSEDHGGSNLKCCLVPKFYGELPSLMQTATRLLSTEGESGCYIESLFWATHNLSSFLYHASSQDPTPAARVGAVCQHMTGMPWLSPWSESMPYL